MKKKLFTFVKQGEHIVNYDPDCSGCPFAQKFEINPEDVTIHEDYIENDVTTNGNDIALVSTSRLSLTTITKGGAGGRGPNVFKKYTNGRTWQK